MSDRRRPVLLSGSQPTGHLTIGNYIGAIRNWVHLQEQYDCLFLMVDLHALTVRNDPKVLRERCYDFAALYMACGLDPERSTIFLQSHVPQHAQLTWVLSCITPFGQLRRMTQFKDKSRRHADNVNAGLFTYPVLMAADILLYRTDLVPVGDDQKQHLELTRDLAEAFNRDCAPVFTLPEPYIPPVGARVMSLQDPTSKMSKTDANPANYIALLDDADTIRRKIRKAVTDPGSEIGGSPHKPAVTNLLTIYAATADEPVEAVEARYAGRGYGQFKADLAELLIEVLRPIRQRYEAIRQDRQALDVALLRGAARACARARHVLADVFGTLGLVCQSG